LAVWAESDVFQDANLPPIVKEFSLKNQNNISLLQILYWTLPLLATPGLEKDFVQESVPQITDVFLELAILFSQKAVSTVDSSDQTSLGSPNQEMVRCQEAG
jgi:hypothetical protein